MNVTLLALALLQQPAPQDTVVLKPVVVTATRVPVPRDAVASAVAVLQGADLEAQGIRTVAQALATTPGANIVETGSFGGQTSLFTRGGESDYTKILVDGVPLNQAGGGIDLAHLTTDNIDRIEIVRGPASVLYGSDAMTGVVQIFTRQGQGPTRAGADFRAGTYGSTEGGLDVTGATQRFSYSARMSRFSSDGLYPFNNYYRNSVISARARYAPDARTDATLSYRYGDDIYHFPTNGSGAPVDSNQRSAERGPMLSVSVGRVLSSHLDARVTAAAHEARQFYNDEPDSPADDGGFWSRDFVRRSLGTVQIGWRSRNRISVIGGLEYEDERQRGKSLSTSIAFGDTPDSILVGRHNMGYFGQAVITSGRAAVTLGSRVDDNSQFGTHGTYRGGVVYRLGEIRLRASVGTGFKEPTFFENYAHGFVVGNPGLKPERTLSWEVGVERGPLTVTYFNQRFRDLIEYNGAVAAGQPNYYNVDGAVADGIEAEVRGNIARFVVASVRYTYLHTRVTKSGTPNDPDGLFVPGERLIRRPAHTVAPQLAATVGERAHVTVGARWVGDRDDLDFSRPSGQRRVRMDPYARVNLSADYDLGRFVLSGSVENIFNDQTQEIPGFRPRGRVVLLGGRVVLGQ